VRGGGIGNMHGPSFINGVRPSPTSICLQDLYRPLSIALRVAPSPSPSSFAPSAQGRRLYIEIARLLGIAALYTAHFGRLPSPPTASHSPPRLHHELETHQEAQGNAPGAARKHL
jgi:hypothetical protein